MHVVYTQRTSGFEPGLSYRNPRFFAGVEKQAKEVTVEGNFPEIVKAYQKAEIKVNVPEESDAETESETDETTGEEDPTGLQDEPPGETTRAEDDARKTPRKNRK